MKRTAAFLLALTLLLTGTAAAVAVPSAEISDGAPSGLVLMPDGSCLFTDTFNKILWHRNREGTVCRYAGRIGVTGLDGAPTGSKTDGPADAASFLDPWDIAPFLDGYVVSDSAANVIRYVANGTVQTAAGNGKNGHRNGNGIRSSFSRPTGLAAGDDGEVYIADTDNGAIRRLDPNGKVTTLCSGLSEPTGLCWQNGVLYVAETGAHRILCIENGVRTVLIGAEGEAGYTDGLVDAARLRDPQDVAVAEDGTVYIADTGNGAVRQLKDGLVTTLISSGEENTPVFPRSLLLQGDVLLISDPFARCIFEVSTEDPLFLDVSQKAWYGNAVHCAFRLGLVNGIGEDRFSPNGKVTRAQMAVMLANLQTCLDRDSIPSGDMELSDVPAKGWYGAQARWAVELGLLSVDGTQFAPNQKITRKEMAVALYRFAQALEADTSARSAMSAYTDTALIAPEAQEAFSWCCATGLIRGISDTCLAPDGSATRAQMAQVMVRFLDLIQNP